MDSDDAVAMDPELKRLLEEAGDKIREKHDPEMVDEVLEDLIEEFEEREEITEEAMAIIRTLLERNES